MKAKILGMAALFVWATAILNAQQSKIITVDHNPGSAAMFSSLQAAHDAANPGDTILIAGSSTTYPAIIITKKINLVGPGYWLLENNIPGLNKEPARLGGVTFQNLELSSPNGSTFTGLATSFYEWSGIQNITIDRCIIGTINGGGNNLVITRSFCAGLDLRNAVNPSVRNSVVHSYLAFSSGGTAQNCVLLVGQSMNDGLVTPPGASVSGMIFRLTHSDASDGRFLRLAQGSITHSLVAGPLGTGGLPSHLPPGAGNSDTIAFLSQVFQVNETTDKYYQLAANSPARGAGLNGTDIGIFGGVQPYVISGVPSLPRITRFLVPATATDTSGLRIEMDAEAF